MLARMTDAPSTDTEAPQQATPKLTVPKDVLVAVRGFVAREGGSAKAVLQPIGAAGVRITLVGEAGGILGDRVVADVATAKAVVDAVNGLEVAEEWDRELISTVTPKKGHYAKMAGWVANQKRFPKARNTAIVKPRLRDPGLG
ncbi:hypothetical protein GII30_12335 [Gordonia amarae]|uniref:Uncharacterized protein n=2 Tax=Gordonia amarae TaxID=36821 RepID=G7GIU9_9ACTN|nr:hypothetical protein GII35_12545 [Gordonia amarae]QHN22223.1 hypothetical protein GII34_12340 [Gordonia amarae]QHN31100.1 hypothetical protein GII32_12500 [Gordonia amarae]QHN39845.1 hypothetical protein GII30_12335 [Gordonia amarae]GAB03524.1 hypothetical protein GOAMR_03_00340 [Gordonia amarae NBRC 15530]